MQISEISPVTLRDVDGQEVLSLHYRLHQLWGANEGGLTREAIVNAHAFVVHELLQRDLSHNTTSSLDTVQLKELDLPGEVVVVDNFVALVGSFVYGEVNHDVDVLLRADSDRDGHLLLTEMNILLPLRKILDPEKIGLLHFIPNAQGPHADYVPLYDLILRRRPNHDVVVLKEMRLDLGCGTRKLAGYIGVDRRPLPGVDYVWDVRQGLPFATSGVDEVRAWHFLEELEPAERVPVMREIWRVLRPGGRFAFEVPRADSLGAEMPFHLSRWTEETFRAFGDPALIQELELPHFAVLDLREVKQNMGWVNIRGILTAVKERMKAQAVKPVVHDLVFAHPADKYLSPDELWENWGVNHVPAFAEMKYNGFRAIVQKREDDVSIMCAGGKEYAEVLPALVHALQKIPQDFIFDADIGIADSAGRWPRVKLATLNAPQPELGEGHPVLTAFDVMYWEGACTTLPFSERRAILAGPVQRAFGPNDPLLQISAGQEVDSLADLRRAYKELGSEGLVVKDSRDPYPWDTPVTVSWAKITPVVELKAIVLGVIEDPAGDQHSIRGGLLVGGSTYRNTVEFAGQEYVDLGESANTAFPVQPGDIVTVNLQELILQPDGTLVWLGAVPQDVDASRVAPYYAVQVVDLARRGKILQDARKAGRDGDEFWAHHWQESFPVSGHGEFVYQHHWRGLSEEEAGLSEKDLLDTTHSVHGDLRLSFDDALWGVSVFLGRTIAVRDTGGDRLASLLPADALQVAFKPHQPKEWLQVGVGKPLVREPGGVGATTGAWAKFFVYDRGEYDIGVWREHLIEIFLHGDKLNGRFLIESVPHGDQRVWQIVRPEDQTPYAATRELDAVLSELREKKQPWLVWGKPGERPQLLEVKAMVKSVEDLGIRIENVAGALATEDWAIAAAELVKALNVLGELEEAEVEVEDYGTPPYDAAAELKRILQTLQQAVADTDIEAAQAALAAVQSVLAESQVTAAMKLIAQPDGSTRWLLVSSGGYQDADDEIVSTALIESAVKQGDSSGQRGPLLIFHIPGSDIGQCDFQALTSGFLLESGTFDSTPAGKAAEAHLKEHAADYGVSIRFLAAERTPEGVYNPPGMILERSILPSADAAFPWSYVELKEFDGMTGLDEKKMAVLRAIVGDDIAGRIVNELEKRARDLQSRGIRFKEAAPKDAVLQSITAQLTEVSKAIQGWSAVSTEIAALKQSVDELKQSDAVKIAAAVDGLSRAALHRMMRPTQRDGVVIDEPRGKFEDVAKASLMDKGG